MTTPDLIAELAEVVRLDGEADYLRAMERALTLFRTHHAEIEAMARDTRLFRLMFPDEVGRELARKTLEAVKP